MCRMRIFLIYTCWTLSASSGFLLDLTKDSCLSRCGDGIDRSYTCQCNEACHSYHDCCQDYNSVCHQGTCTRPTNDYLTKDSCLSRCGDGIDRSYTCQCNEACHSYHDCCQDYNSVCHKGTCTPPTNDSTCTNVTTVSSQMWTADVNRLPGQAYHLNYQAQVPDHSTVDKAQDKLFQRLDKTYLSKPTFQAAIKLMDNYDPHKGVSEKSTSEKTLEVNHFLDEALKTKVMDVLLDNLKCRGVVQDQKELRSLLYRLWFQNYHRSGSGHNADTSGFEHVMVGEYQNDYTVSGFHGWLSYYLKEQAGDINYRGYVRRLLPDLVGAAFTWHGRQKTMGAFMAGTSPEFDLALFTLCYVAKGDSTCPTRLNGQNITVKTYNSHGHMASAYMAP